jgi:hypothetical protein
MAVGSGALAHPKEYPSARLPELPDATWLARAVAEGRAERTGTAPLYLRRPDARPPAARKRVLQPQAGP